MHTYFKSQRPAMQLAVFFGLVGACFLVNYVITKTFFSDLGPILLDKNAVITSGIVNRFKLAQFIGATISFILPPLIFGYLFSPKPLPFIGIQPRVNLLLVSLGIVIILSVQPLVGYLGNLNAKINFGSMQSVLEETEKVYTRVLNSFLKMDSVGDLVINLFIMALLPAIGEELFFRGVLQKILVRITNLPLVAILVSAAVFALFHGTFFKILPIFALGLMLGTIFQVTRNLWYSIIIHFINNALAVLAVYFSSRNEAFKNLADDKVNYPVFAVMISLVITVGLIMFMKKRSEEVLPVEIANEENENIA